jgi:hypothetical protein
MDDGWAVVIAGKPANERELDVYPKQKEAIGGAQDSSAAVQERYRD